MIWFALGILAAVVVGVVALRFALRRFDFKGK
jgi:hypothetical protein